MKMKKIISIVVSVSLVWWNLSFAAPEGGVVAAGNATISQSGNTTQVTQTSQNAVINWQGFNTTSNEAVNFSQPNSSAIALNRINSGLPTSFAGSLNANGHVWIINPAGVLFTNTARIDVGGILATTADISNSNFMNGNYHFVQAPNVSPSVINNGEIKATQLAALVAPNVENNGVIQANLGKVVLGAGGEYVVDMYGDNVINFAVGSTVKTSIKNNGQIYADSGKVVLTAKAAAGVVDNVIGMDGMIAANSVVQGKDGSIILSGGENSTVLVSGTMKAKSVKVLGDKVGLINNAKIEAQNGEVLMGGNYKGEGPEQNASATYMGANAEINADNGRVILWSDDYTGFYGTINAANGFVETSSHDNLQAFGSVIADQWLLDPSSVNITSVTTSGGSFGGGNPNIFTPTATTAVVDVATINSSLNAGTSVTINTGSAAGGVGDILVNAPISKTAGGPATLTLNAFAGIFLNNSISNTAPTPTINFLDVVLNASQGGGIQGINQTAGGLIGVRTVTASSRGFIVLDEANAITNFNATSIPSISTNHDVILNNSAALNITGISTDHSATINNAGSVTLGTIAVGRDLNLNVTSGDLIIAAPSSVTVGGNLALSAQNDITQSFGNLNVNGVSSFSSTGGSGAINLTGGFGNSFHGAVVISNPNIAANNTLHSLIELTIGGVTVGGNLTVDSLNSIVIGASTIGGNLILDSSVGGSGPISQTGALSVTGTSRFNVGANPITLTDASNNFIGAVSLNNTGNNPVTIAASGDLALTTSSIGGDFTVNLNNADLTQINPITVGGTSSFSTGNGEILLNDPSGNVFTGAINLNNTAGQVFLTSAGANTILNTVNVDELLVLSFVAPLTQAITSTIQTLDNAFFGSNADIVLTGAANSFGGSHQVGLFAGANADLIATTPVVLADKTFDSTLYVMNVGGNLNLQAAGISQIDFIPVAGTSTFIAGNNPITLDNINNVFGGVVSVNNSGANNITVSTSSALQIGASTIGNSLTLNADGIAQTAALVVPANATFNSGATGVNLSNANNDFNMLFMTAGAGGAVITDVNGLQLNNISIINDGNLLITTGGNLNQTGVLNVLNGSLDIIATAPLTDINLASAANNLGGFSLSTSGAGTIQDVQLRNVAATAATPAIGALRNLTLLFDNAAINLAATTLISGGSLNLAAGGGVTQSGAWIVPGTTTINAFNNPIALVNSANNFSGAITLTNVGNNNAALVNSVSTVLGPTNIGGNLAITSGGTIKQTGAINSVGLTTSSVGGTLLNNVNNAPLVFNATNTGGGNIEFTNSDPLSITGISQSGGGQININNFGQIVISGPVISDGGSITMYSNGPVGAKNIFVNALISTGTNGRGFLVAGPGVVFNALASLGDGYILLDPASSPMLVNPVTNSWWDSYYNAAPEALKVNDMECSGFGEYVQSSCKSIGNTDQ